MTTRVLLDPAFVLHHRPYLNSSLIVELFSLNHGRIAAIARSARGPKSRYKGSLQNFTPLLVSWSGQRELMNLNHVELNGLPYSLPHQPMLCAFYLNELVLRLIPRDDPYPDIFADYQDALQGLTHQENIQVVLRRFEKRLITHLGYGLSFYHIVPEYFYRWQPNHGFLRCEHTEHSFLFPGSSLLALAEEKWENPQDLIAAKHLMRLVLNHYLGDKPLKTRELLSAVKPEMTAHATSYS